MTRVPPPISKIPGSCFVRTCSEKIQMFEKASCPLQALLSIWADASKVPESRLHSMP